MASVRSSGASGSLWRRRSAQPGYALNRRSATAMFVSSINSSTSLQSKEIWWDFQIIIVIIVIIIYSVESKVIKTTNQKTHSRKKANETRTYWFAAFIP